MDKLSWFKSRYSSGNGQCVERARIPDGGMVRPRQQTPVRPGPGLPAQWETFLSTIRTA
jgi:hypothetical protein